MALSRRNLLDILFELGLNSHIVQRRPFKFVQKRICNGIRQMVFKRLALEYGVFNTIYKDKEKIAVHKNGYDMRKSPGYSVWVRALVLILYKEDPAKMYKIEFATESHLW
jgi:hypothetical protein